ncbi:MAG: hypothetical protein ACOX7X_00315 [Methanosarcina flavescens]
MTAWSSGSTLGDKRKLFKKKFDQKQHFRSSLFVKGLQHSGFDQEIERINRGSA